MVIVTSMLYLSGSDFYFTYNKGKGTTENHRSKKEKYVGVNVTDYLPY